MADALEDLLNTPSEEEGVWWTLALIAISDEGGFGPAYEMHVGEEEAQRILRDFGKNAYVIEKFTLKDYSGDSHVWFGVRILSMIRSTSASRESERRTAIYGQLQNEKLEKQIRQELGML